MSEKWNTRVECIDNKDNIFFTKGYIYRIKNGVIFDDRYKAHGEYSDVQALNSAIKACFIEI